MLKRFVFAREDRPDGPWLAPFAAGRDEAERWYQGERAGPRRRPPPRASGRIAGAVAFRGDAASSAVFARIHAAGNSRRSRDHRCARTLRAERLAAQVAARKNADSD